MPTLELQRKTIDVYGVPDIDFSAFEDPEIFLIEALLKQGQHDSLAAAIHAMTPEKEKIIAQVQAAFRGNAFVFKSKTQQEFEMWMSQNPNEITPEIEREWQAKIDAERSEYLKSISGQNMIEKVEMNAKGGSKIETGTISNNLIDLPDLPASSREKLNTEGVTSIDQFRAMPYEKKQEVLGYKVAGRFKDFN